MKTRHEGHRWWIYPKNINLFGWWWNYPMAKVPLHLNSSMLLNLIRFWFINLHTLCRGDRLGRDGFKGVSRLQNPKHIVLWVGQKVQMTNFLHEISERITWFNEIISKFTPQNGVYHQFATLGRVYVTSQLDYVMTPVLRANCTRHRCSSTY